MHHFKMITFLVHIIIYLSIQCVTSQPNKINSAESSVSTLISKLDQVAADLEILTQVRNQSSKVQLTYLIQENIRLFDINKNISRQIVELINANNLALKNIEKLQQEQEHMKSQLSKFQTNCSGDSSKVTASGNQIVGGLELIQIGQGKYYIEKFVTLSWDNAKLFCSGHKLQLLSIETKEENLELQNYFINTLDAADEWYFWTSGSEINDARDYAWTSTNQAVTYKAYTELNQEKKHNRLYTLKNKSNQLGWDNWEGSWRSRFICELNH